MGYNLAIQDNYIFNATISGVNVYDSSGVALGFIYNDETSYITTDINYLYVATTGSGLYRYPISSIASGIYNDWSLYQAYPSITNNYIVSTHSKGDNLVLTTLSGVDFIEILTDNRYYCVDDIEYYKCFVTTGSSLYYITKDSTDTFYGYGNKLYEIKLNARTSVDGYQVKVELTTDNFDFSDLINDGANIRFYDVGYNALPFYLESLQDSLATIWVNLLNIGTSVFYLVITNDTVSTSDPEAVFNLFDDFNSLDTGKWDIIAGDYNNYYLFDGTNEVIFSDFFNNSSSNPVFYAPWDGSGTFMTWICPMAVDGSKRCVFTDNNENEMELLIYSDRIVCKMDYSTPIISYNMPVNIKQWYHLAITHEKDIVNDLYIHKLYVDGELCGQVEVVISSITNYGPEGPLRVGRYFKGLISDIKVYDYVLDEVGIQSSMNVESYEGEPGLVAYYPVNEGTGNIIYDYSGNNHNSESITLKWAGFTVEGSSLVQRVDSGYIISKTSIDFPCVVQQKINFSNIFNSNKIYSVCLEQNREGMVFYRNNNSKTFDIYFNNLLELYYNPNNELIVDDTGVLSITFTYNMIKFDFESDTRSLSDSWVGNSYNSSGKLKLFDQEYGATVVVDWVRVRKLDFDTRVIEINEKNILLTPKNKLNVVYNVNSNWSNNLVDYYYNVDTGVSINDIMVTENTSIYGGNVIFLATSDGVHVIEENRGSENINRIKYYKST